MTPNFYYGYEEAYIPKEVGEEIPKVLGKALFHALPGHIRDNKIVVLQLIKCGEGVGQNSLKHE